jgi:DNA-binding transcriptional ArsR family regulator
MKSPKDLEQILKGCANHRRIETLLLLRTEPELTLEQIAEHLGVNFRTASEHMRRMAVGGLLMKRYEGTSVHHTLTRRGKDILAFLKTLA